MGKKRVYGLVLAENTNMLALAKKLGFKIKKSPEGPEYELCIDLLQTMGESEPHNPGSLRF